MGVAPAFRSTAVQAILGPARSQLVPSTLWIGWLDGGGDLIAMAGMPVSHDVFGPSGDGVQNIVPIDCGVAGPGWEIHAVGLFDGPSGDLMLSAGLASSHTPEEGDPLVFQVGGLTFTVGGPA